MALAEYSAVRHLCNGCKARAIRPFSLSCRCRIQIDFMIGSALSVFLALADIEHLPIAWTTAGAPEQQSWTCPHCGRTSFNPKDIENRFCGACRHFF